MKSSRRIRISVGKQPRQRRSRLLVKLSPSFRGLKASSAVASTVGKGNKRRDTNPEIALRHALWTAGVRYRLSGKRLPGNPDIVIRRYKLVVFCDGDFWHGRLWLKRRARLAAGANAEYWLDKIGNNRRRDRAVNRQLKRLGWQVVRVWESEVMRNAGEVARRIQLMLKEP